VLLKRKFQVWVALVIRNRLLLSEGSVANALKPTPGKELW